MRREPARTRTRASACLLAALLACVGAVAADGDTLEQVLAPWRPLWDRLTPTLQAQLQDNARHWIALDPAARARLRERAAAFDALPAAERARIRSGWQQMQTLPASHQQQLRAAWARYAALPPAQQAAWRARWDALPAADRPRLQPGDDALAALAAQTFPFVPESDRDATLALLAGLDDADRARLQQLQRRWPPWRREALRRALLDLPPEARSAHLRAQTGD